MWYYLYDAATGVLISESDIEISPPVGFGVRSSATRKSQDASLLWDETARDFVARPALRLRTMTPHAFLELFTPQERIGIRTAAKTDVVIEDYLDLLSKANEVNLDSTNTVNGVGYLVMQGLLTAARGAEIRA